MGLGYLDKMAFRVGRADAAGDVAVLRNGILQVIGNHGSPVRCIAHPLQGISHGSESVLAVIVVGVDDGEGLVNLILCAHDGVHRAVGLGTLGRGNETAGKGIIFLIGVGDLHLFGDLVADHFTEHLVHTAADDKNHLIKTGFDGIIDGVFHQDFTVGANAVHLFVTAVTGSESSCHDQKRRIHRKINLLPGKYMKILA